MSNLFDRDLILSQYLTDPTPKNLELLIKALISGGDLLDPIVEELAQIYDLTKYATEHTIYESEILDLLGLYRGLKRDYGESNADFAARILASINAHDAGTPNRVIKSAARISGDSSPTYFDEVKATFFIYTPYGRQLLRSQVKALAPAGVLGLPGAAIITATPQFLVTAKGERILAVAQDKDRVQTTTALLTEASEEILTENGETIFTEGNE